MVAPAPAPSLQDLRRAPVLAVDLNHGHLAGWVITPDGNPHGPPVTVPLQLAGLPATQRDGRLRAAISELIRLARAHGCRSIAIEDLDFAASRAEGRERSGNRPSHGRRGRAFRRIVAGISTARFRDRLAQMAANQGLAVIAADPAYTSRWGAEHWLAPLREHNTVTTTGHHAAAVVIGRRAHGHKARRRAGVTGTDQRISRRRATPRAPQARPADRNGGPRQAPRPPPPRRRKTGPAHRGHPPDQAAHDRSGPPDNQDHLQLSVLGTVAVPVHLLPGESFDQLGDAAQPTCWEKYVPPGRSTRAISAHQVVAGCRLTTRSKASPPNGSGGLPGSATTATPRGCSSRVALSMFGGHGQRGQRLRPGEHLAAGLAVQRGAGRAIRSSVTRPSSPEKFQPTIGAASASATRSSSERGSSGRVDMPSIIPLPPPGDRCGHGAATGPGRAGR
jgi:hypothetical protein